MKATREHSPKRRLFVENKMWWKTENAPRDSKSCFYHAQQSSVAGDLFEYENNF